MSTLQRLRVLTWYYGRGGTGRSNRGWEREEMREEWTRQITDIERRLEMTRKELSGKHEESRIDR
jgi:hypothetical protein